MIDLTSALHRQFVWTTPVDVYVAPSWARLIAQDVRLIRGSDRSDRIEVGEANGEELHARFSGLAGTDVLVGGARHDFLLGGSGDDTLNGQARRDVCDGGTGTNTLTNCES